LSPQLKDRYAVKQHSYPTIGSQKGKMRNRILAYVLNAFLNPFISFHIASGFAIFQPIHTCLVFKTRTEHLTNTLQNQITTLSQFYDGWGPIPSALNRHSMNINAGSLGQNDNPLVPEENPKFSLDNDIQSVAGVPYRRVLSGINFLYPPEDLDERNAASRSDGYWSYIEDGIEVPKYSSYGEFDLFFFAELLDRSCRYIREEDTKVEKDHRSSGWEGKVFVDIGSGSGRLVLSAAALHPFVLCRGIEVLPGIHNLALKALERCGGGSNSTNSEAIVVESISNDPQLLDPPEPSTKESFLSTKEVDDFDSENSILKGLGNSQENDNESLLTPALQQNVDALNNMTAAEWKDILSGFEFDEDFMDDWESGEEYNVTNKTAIGLNLTDVTEVEQEAEIINNEDELDEKSEALLEQMEVDRQRQRVNPIFPLLPEIEMIKSFEASQKTTRKYYFESFEEFEQFDDKKLAEMFQEVPQEEVMDTNTYFDQNFTDSHTTYSYSQVDKYIMMEPSNHRYMHLKYDNQSSSNKIQPVYNSSSKLNLAPVQFSCGSFQDPYEYIGDVDVAFAFSTCYTEEMMKDLSQAFGRQCKSGTIVITTDIRLPMQGYIDPLVNDSEMPFGEYEFELMETIQGWCWLTGGESVAYIYQLVKSLNVNGMEKREANNTYPEDEAWRIIQAIRSGSLADTKKFLRDINNSLAFHGYG